MKKHPPRSSHSMIWQYELLRVFPFPSTLMISNSSHGRKTEREITFFGNPLLPFKNVKKSSPLDIPRNRHSNLDGGFFNKIWLWANLKESFLFFSFFFFLFSFFFFFFLLPLTLASPLSFHRSPPHLQHLICLSVSISFFFSLRSFLFLASSFSFFLLLSFFPFKCSPSEPGCPNWPSSARQSTLLHLWLLLPGSSRPPLQVPLP